MFRIPDVTTTAPGVENVSPSRLTRATWFSPNRENAITVEPTKGGYVVRQYKAPQFGINSAAPTYSITSLFVAMASGHESDRDDETRFRMAAEYGHDNMADDGKAIGHVCELPDSEMI